MPLCTILPLLFTFLSQAKGLKDEVCCYKLRNVTVHQGQGCKIHEHYHVPTGTLNIKL